MCDVLKRGRGAFFAPRGCDIHFHSLASRSYWGVHAHVSTGWDDEVRCPEAGLRRIFGAHGCDSPFHSPAQRVLLRGLARIYVQGRLMRYDVQRMDGWALSAHTGATIIFTLQHSVFTGGDVCAYGCRMK